MEPNPINASRISQAKSIDEISHLWKSCDPKTNCELVNNLATQTIYVLSTELNRTKESESLVKKLNVIKDEITHVHDFLSPHRMQKVLKNKEPNADEEYGTILILEKVRQSIDSFNGFLKDKSKINKLLKSSSAKSDKLEKMADSLSGEFKGSIIENGELASYAIKLYERAASKYRVQGRLKEAIAVRKKIADPGLMPSQFPLKKISALSKYSVAMEHPIIGSIDFGMTCSFIGSTLVKGGNIHMREFTLDGLEKKEVSFKLNYWAADRLRENIRAFQDPKANLLLEESGLCHGVTINDKDQFYYYPKAGTEFTEKGKLEMGGATTIVLHGLASITIGNDPQMGSMYNRVTVDLKHNATAFDVQKALALLGLGELTAGFNSEDLERMKINILFHHYFPREAFVLERDEGFYQLSIDELKEVMIKKCPEMNQILAKKLQKMTAYEISPGEVGFLIPGIAEEAKNLGARGLIAGASGTIAEAGKCVACILQSGFASSQTRSHNGLLLGGASSKEDHQRNSADSVYMRVVTQKAIDGRVPLSSIPLIGCYQVMCKLDLFDMHPYVHKQDFYGCRNPSSPGYGPQYAARPSLQEHIIKNQDMYERSNEVMFKSRVDSSYIAGVTYQDPRRILISDIKARSPAFFPVGLSDIEQMDYVENFPDKVEQELSNYPDFTRKAVTNEAFYKRLPIKKHWVLDPKKFLIEELRKLGYKNDFNAIPFDDLIKEKREYDEVMFKRCHENV